MFSGFKTQDLLAFFQCAVAIPPSKHLNIQKIPTDKRKTSRTKNVRIYVEQATKNEDEKFRY